MKISKHIAASALAIAATAPMPMTAAQAATINTNFGVIDSNGNCGVQLPFDNGKKLEFNVRAKDGNLNIRVQNLPADLVKAGKDKPDFPITMIFDGKKKLDVETGYYSAGFYYEARGYWKDSANGAPIMRAFKDAKSITLKFDGQTFGPVSTQADTINLAYGMIKTCVDRNGGIMPGGNS